MLQPLSVTDPDLSAEVCIIGAGAAGITIARKLATHSISVILCEAGGLEYTDESQSVYRGKVEGDEYYDLDIARLRYFGGTTNHWTAWVRPLEPIDFEARSWVPHSGWPFGIDDLGPYYERAAAFLGLPDRPFDVAAWSDAERRPWAFEGDRVESRVLQIVAPERRRLGVPARPQLERSSNVDVYLHANVLELVPDANAKPLAVPVSTAVMGCGTVITPRLAMMLSNNTSGSVFALLLPMSPNRLIPKVGSYSGTWAKGMPVSGRSGKSVGLLKSTSSM